MEENLLDIWKNNIDQLKWKLARPFDPPFKDVNKIIENLLTIFPKEDFIMQNGKISNINFLTSLLISNPIIALHKLSEYSKSIEFLNNHPDNLELHQGRINYDEIQDRFFELFVNRLLENSGLKTSLTDSYQINGKIKPIDGSFNYQGQRYLVECKKIYNSKQDLIKELVFETLSFHLKFSTSFSLEELFGGYIRFKNPKLNPKLKNSALEKFRELLKEYYKTFRNNNSDTIKGHFEFKNDDFEIVLMPALMFSNQKENIYKESGDIILFEAKMKNENSITGVVELKYNVKLSHYNLEDFLYRKMKDKISQHRNSPINNKIFAFEFENVSNFNQFKNSLPIKSEFFEKDRFAKLVDNQTAILLVLKSVGVEEVRMDFGVVSSNKFNKQLKYKLENPVIK